MVASNYLLSDTAEGQFNEMKTVAERNTKVKKWALTGYISQPDEIGRKLKDEEFQTNCYGSSCESRCDG